MMIARSAQRRRVALSGLTTALALMHGLVTPQGRGAAVLTFSRRAIGDVGC